MAVTGFGNWASAHGFTAGMLRGDKPQIGHQLFGVWESSHIANLRSYSGGHNMRYASQGLVGLGVISGVNLPITNRKLFCDGEVPFR